MSDKTYDVVILGSGPSGLTAAIYTSRANLSTFVFAGNPPGGQLTTTTEVENFPGFTDGIMGPELVSNMRKQAEKFNTNFADENVVNIEGDFASGFSVKGESGKTIIGKTVIVATGASAKWLEVNGENDYRGRGVSACATCDGFFFKDKLVGVVGGGDAAMEEAIFLTKFASKVVVFVRGAKEDMKASAIMRDRAFANKKIEFKFNSEIHEIFGDSVINGVLLYNNSEKRNQKFELQGLFVAIGHKPNTDFLKNFIDIDEKGYIEVHNNTYTSKDGVFVSGDVHDHRYRQAITAAGFGCMAALDVEKYLSSLK